MHRCVRFFGVLLVAAMAVSLLWSGIADAATLSQEDFAALSCSQGAAQLQDALAKKPDLNKPLPGEPQGLTPLMACLEKRREDLAQILLDAGASAAPKSQAGWTALDLAAGYASYETMAKLIQADGDVNGSGDFMPLFTAVQYNPDVQVTRLLIQSGANVQKTNAAQETALMRAALNPNAAVFSLLLQNGANWRAVTNDNRTALFFAAENRNTSALEQLLGMGLSSADRSAWQTTPLFNAVMSGNQQGVAVLLHAGADPRVVDKNGQTLLHGYFPYKDPAQEGLLAMLLRAGVNPNAVDNAGVTPLLYAAENAPTDRLPVLLVEAGADVSKADNRGITPLLMACLNERPTVLAYLLSRGADPRVADNYGSTAVMYALMPLSYAIDSAPWLEMIQTLLDAGVAVNGQNVWGRTALSLAASGNSVEIVRFLLERGADAALLDHWNMSALFWAAYSGSVPKVEALLPVSNTTLTDKEGQDVFFWAAASPVRGKVISYLLQKGLQPCLADGRKRTPLMYLASAGDPADIPLLIKAGCKPNAVDDLGRSALMWSVTNQPDMLGALLDAGVSPDLADQDGRTALHYFAAVSTNPLAVNRLCQAAKQVDAPDTLGRTPLMYASALAPVPVLLALLENGAKINLTDKNGWTPLHYFMSGVPTKEGMTIFLLQRVNGSVKDEKGATALHVSGQYLNIPPPVPCPEFSAQNDDRRPKVQCRTKTGPISTEVLGAMMQIVHGIDTRDNYGRSAFMLFAQNCLERKPLEKFVWAGAMINTIDNSGVTPLMYAARGNKSVVAVDYLLEVHASLDTADLSGKTALIHAAEAGADFSIIERLVSEGANKTHKDNQGKIALDYLQQNQSKYGPDFYKHLVQLLTP